MLKTLKYNSTTIFSDNQITCFTLQGVVSKLKQ